MNKNLTAIALLVLLNIILRFYGIGSQSIWLDEGYSINEAQFPTSEIIRHSAESDNPPLYYILLHFWIKIFGDSEAGARSLSAVCGCIASVLIFIFLKKNYTFFAALFAALLITFSNIHIFYSQETRTYELVVLLTVISIGLFLRLLNTRKKYLYFLLILVNAALLYTHYLSLFVPLSQLLVSLFYVKSNIRFTVFFFCTFLLTIICFIPWLHVPLNNLPKPGKFWLNAADFGNFKGVFISFLGNKIALVFSSLLLIYGCWKYFSERRSLISMAPELFLFILFFFPVVVTYFLSAKIPVFLLRYLLFASVPLYILIAFITDFGIKNEKVKYLVAIILLILCMTSIQLKPSKDENWKEAVRYLQKVRNGNIAILSADYSRTVFTYYYHRELFRKKDKTDAGLISANIFPVKTLDEAGYNALPVSEKIYVIFSHDEDADPDGTVKKIILQNRKEIDVRTFEKIKVVTYE
jgi:mannosyltransferase